jgi:hypothetical protein
MNHHQKRENNTITNFNFPASKVEIVKYIWSPDKYNRFQHRIKYMNENINS